MISASYYIHKLAFLTLLSIRTVKVVFIIRITDLREKTYGALGRLQYP